MNLYIKIAKDIKKLIIENIIGIIIGTGIAFLLIYLFNKKRK